MKNVCGFVLENYSWYKAVINLYSSNEHFTLKEIKLLYEHQKITRIQHGEKHEFYIITGSGASNAASNAEFLRNFNINMLIRIGTTGSLTNNLNIGDIVNVIAAIKGDGVSKYYLPEYIPAMADIKLFKSIGTYLDTRMRVVEGLVFTTAARYKEDVDELKKMVRFNVIGIEMESAALLAVGLDRKIPTISLCIVSDIPINDCGENIGMVNKKAFQIVEDTFESLFKEMMNWIIIKY